jgi:hypothetical protein
VKQILFELFYCYRNKEVVESRQNHVFVKAEFKALFTSSIRVEEYFLKIRCQELIVGAGAWLNGRALT